MNPIQNPFSPGAGTAPPELVGRDALLSDARIILSRVLLGKPERSLILTGLRGVGKTVMLKQIESIAREFHYTILSIEVLEGRKLGETLAPVIRRELLTLGAKHGFHDLEKKSLSALRNFVSAAHVKIAEVELGLDLSPERGLADSGNIENDLPDLLLVLAEAAKNKGSAVLLLVDEMQYLTKQELSALILAVHRVQQNQIPFSMAGAGLPNLPKLAGEAKSYAERLFLFPEIGPLTEEETKKALQDPVQGLGCTFSEEALKEIFTKTRGYPYFVQEWGSHSWNMATKKDITVQDVHRATKTALEQLDNNFFRVRFDRLTPQEKVYLRALAQLGPGVHKSGDVAAVLGVSYESLGPVRDKVLKKGMAYSPSHGLLAFTVPLFDEFMFRVMPAPPEKKNQAAGQDRAIGNLDSGS
ncbi:MAG: ATP-binding protein [Leptospirales bacterium]